MDQVTAFINQDVTVVPVLDLQDVTHNTIGCQTLDEVGAGKLELIRTLTAIALQEILVQVYFEGLAKLISAVSIRDDFNDASKGLGHSCPVADALVRCDIKI